MFTPTLWETGRQSNFSVPLHALSSTHTAQVVIVCTSVCVCVCRFEKELKGLLEGGVPENIPHPLLLPAHLHSSPHPHSTGPKAHAPLTRPLPTRKSLGDQVDRVVQELVSLK